MRHFVVKRDLPIGRRLVGGEDPSYDVGPRGYAADVRKLFEAEGLDDFVEVGSVCDWKTSEQNSP